MHRGGGRGGGRWGVRFSLRKSFNSLTLCTTGLMHNGEIDCKKIKSSLREVLITSVLDEDQLCLVVGGGGGGGLYKTSLI